MFSDSDPDDISEDSSSTSKKLAKNFAMIALLAISILSTELTISWNHIHGVTSPSTLRSVGQLVPLVIALGQLICVLYLALRGEEKMRVNEENESGKSYDVYLHPNLQTANSKIIRSLSVTISLIIF